MTTLDTVTDAAVLAAILAGRRTEPQIAEAVGIAADHLFQPVLGRARAAGVTVSPDDLAPWRSLNGALRRLLLDGLLFMRVVDAEWHYLPTRKARVLRVVRRHRRPARR